MRIPLAPSPYAALMSGITRGTSIAHSEAQNAALAAQTNNMQQLLALKQQLQPAQLKAYSDAAAASQASTNSINTLLPAKLQALSDTHALAAYRHLYIAHLLSGGPQTSPTSNATPLTSTSPIPSQGALPSSSPGVISVTPTGQVTTPNGTVISPVGQIVSRPNLQSSPAAPLASVNGGTSANSTPALSTKWQEVGQALGYKPIQPIISPQQKEALAVNQATQIAQNTSQIKTAQGQVATAEKAIPALIKTINALKTMKNISIGPEGHGFMNNGIFYPGSSAMKYISNDPDRANYIAASSTVLGQLDRAFSQRGSSYALRAAKGFKPGVNYTAGYNTAMATHYLNSAQNELKLNLSIMKSNGVGVSQFGDLSPQLDPTLAINPNVTPTNPDSDPMVPVTYSDGSVRMMTRSAAIAAGAKPK